MNLYDTLVVTMVQFLRQQMVDPFGKAKALQHLTD
jgi:hypothetical protein